MPTQSRNVVYLFPLHPVIADYVQTRHDTAGRTRVMQFSNWVNGNIARSSDGHNSHPRAAMIRLARYTFEVEPMPVWRPRCLALRNVLTYRDRRAVNWIVHPMHWNLRHCLC